VTFGPVAPDLIASFAQPVWEAFDLTVELQGSREIPEQAWDPARQQYSSEILLRELLTVRPRGQTGPILGVTGVDLCIPMLSFVFGQAQLRGTAAVVSTARLDPGFYGLPPHPEVVTRRLVREVIHEVGHTVGLVHCHHVSCPMSLATGVEGIDGKEAELCDGCAAAARDLRRGRGGPLSGFIGQRKSGS
jgi:archaemetzincin